MSRFKEGDKITVITYGKDKFMITATTGIITSVIVNGNHNSLYMVLLPNKQEIEVFCSQVFTEVEAKKEFNKWLNNGM
tara:strand:+ start:849 stop:1082 length:234 start_codon:yes stop_codon:yes gene_type:complete